MQWIITAKLKRQKKKKIFNEKILKFNDYKDCLLNNKIIVKPQQRFKSERHFAYTEDANKIALSSNDDKRLKLLKYKMINFDDCTHESKTEHNSRWPYIPNHPNHLDQGKQMRY